MKNLFLLFIFISTNFFSQEIIPIKSFGRVGFYDFNEEGRGVEIIPAKYEDCRYFKDGLVAVKLSNKWGFIDSSDQTVIPFIYDNAIAFSEGYGATFTQGKWGFVDNTGKNIIPNNYDTLDLFYEGFAAVNLNGKWGFINTENKKITAIEYEDVSRFHEGRAGVKLDGKWGFIDYTGKLVIPCIYDYETYDENKPYKYFYNEGVAFVMQNNKWGVIDKEGKALTAFVYETKSNLEFDNGRAFVYKDGKGGLIDLQGKEVVPCKYEYIYSCMILNSFPVNYFVAGALGSIGIIDENGKIIFPFELDGVGDYSKETGLITIHPKEGTDVNDGLINLKGELLTQTIYEGIGDFSQNPKVKTAIFQKYDQGDYDTPYEKGILDVSGKELTTKYYDMLEPFSEGLALACIDGKCGYLDENGREVIDLKYDQAMSFLNGMAPVKNGEKWGVIDVKGREIVSPQFDDAKYCKVKGYAIVKKGDLWGVINQKGKTVVDFKYNEITPYCDGKLYVEKAYSYGGGDVVLIDTTSLVWHCTIGGENYFLDKNFNSKQLKYNGYHSVYGIGRNLFKVILNEKIGFIDHTGKEIIPAIYDAENDDFIDNVGYDELGIPLYLGKELFWFDKNGVRLR